jgi:repressor LexA
MKKVRCIYMTIANKIREARESANLTQKQLADMLGVPARTYGSYERGERDISTDVLKKVCEVLKVSSDYLLGRKSPALSEAEPLPTIKTYWIPVFESVSAGFGAYASDCICGYMPLYISSPSEAEQTIIIRVRGDSMYPVIPDGACVQVLRQDYAENGQIVVMLIDGDEGVLKRYFANAERQEVRLESYNPAYPPRIFRAAELNKLRLVGVAKRVITDLP